MKERKLWQQMMELNVEYVQILLDVLQDRGVKYTPKENERFIEVVKKMRPILNELTEVCNEN